LTNKQVTLDECLSQRFNDKLRKASIIASRTSRPVILYRNTIEENDNAAEEELATVNEKYVIVQVFTHGGFIPPNFQQQFVFTLEEFPAWIIQRSHDLLLQCLESLDEQIIVD
jgi:hypothetical protein